MTQKFPSFGKLNNTSFYLLNIITVHGYEKKVPRFPQLIIFIVFCWADTLRSPTHHELNIA